MVGAPPVFVLSLSGSASQVALESAGRSEVTVSPGDLCRARTGYVSENSLQSLAIDLSRSKRRSCRDNV